jgi:hypothetical protein
MNLKTIVSDTCVWCIAIAIAALSLLTVVWVVILASA